MVSDGSTDGTVEIARSLGLRTIHLLQNQGKGRAMAIGVAHTDAEILLFVDGDILNLTVDLLNRLIEPVLSGRSDMNVGIRHRGRPINAIQDRTGPLLSGIRCLRREVFEAVPESHREGFAIETGLNWACRQLGCRTTTTVMYNLKHLVKEKKRGLCRRASAPATGCSPPCSAPTSSCSSRRRPSAATSRPRPGFQPSSSTSTSSA